MIFELMHDYPRYTIVAITFALGIGTGAVFLVNAAYHLSHRVTLKVGVLGRLRLRALGLAELVLNLIAIGIPPGIVFATIERYGSLELTGFEPVATLVVCILVIWIGMRARHSAAKPNTNSEL